MQIYQDIWVNGEIKTKGIRDCENRYKPIQELCKKYKRPFTVLDIGANLGYFSFRLSSEFDCVSVMVEGQDSFKGELVNLINQQKCNDRLVFLATKLDLQKLRELSKCEHFDVVLALRVVHHFNDPFDQVIEAIISLGDHTFFELPTGEEDSVCAKDRIQEELRDHDAMLSNYKYEKVGEYSIHVGSGLSPMYLVENPKNLIIKSFYGGPRFVKHLIKSGYNSKTLMKRGFARKRGGTLTREWIAGINLFTFLSLDGVYPKRMYIAKQIKNYTLPKDCILTDVRPWNFILMGNKLNLIDNDSLLTTSGKQIDMENECPEDDLYRSALFTLMGLKDESYFPRISINKMFGIKSRLIIHIIKKVFKSLKAFLRLNYGYLREVIDIVFSSLIKL